jgi:hypothetical protein
MKKGRRRNSKAKEVEKKIKWSVKGKNDKRIDQKENKKRRGGREENGKKK